MRAHRLHQGGFARNSAQFRPGNRLHGLGQRRKPCHFAILGTPMPGLLNHHLLLTLAAARSGSRTNPVAEIPFPQAWKKDRRM
jgi:hypothetical protein